MDRMPKASRAVAPLLAALLLAGCDDGTGLDLIGHTAAGGFDFVSRSDLPAGTRVLVAWTRAGDSYVWGEGELVGSGWFVDLDEPPPNAALHDLSGALLGVGFVYLTTEALVGEGSAIEDVPAAQIVGASARHAIIYIEGNPDFVDEAFGWGSAFEMGYSVGVGVPLPGTTREGFEPISPSDPVIIVDDVADLDFVDWI